MTELILKNSLTIQGDYDEIRIKNSLTFPNPAFEKTKRYSRYAYTSVPENLFYFEKDGDDLRVPIGYDISTEYEHISDERVKCEVNYPSFNLKLREDQETAVGEYVIKNTLPYPLNGMICMPTGKGKSIVALFLSHILKAKTLIIVHKNDLIVGWQKDIYLAFDGKVEPGLIKEKKRDIGEQITLATVQTLNRLSKEELNVLTQTFSLVVMDEMHHVSAPYFNIVGQFNSRYKIGLTATPERSDGLTHLLHVFMGGFAYKYETREDDTDILPVLVNAERSDIYVMPVLKYSNNRYSFSRILTNPKEKLKKNEVLINEIDYDSRPMIKHNLIEDAVVLHPDYGEQVLTDVMNEYEIDGRSIIMFFSKKEHCLIYYESLVDIVGENNVQLYYGDSTEKDEVLLKRAENRKPFITITTYSKGTEGTNVKQWEVAFFVSSMNNEKNVEQATGRIRRTKKGKINPCIVYDYSLPNVYTMGKHFSTRLKRYQKMGCQIEGLNQKRLKTTI